MFPAADLQPTAIDPNATTRTLAKKKTVVSALTSTTPVKITLGVVIGALVSLGVWGWDRLDRRVDGKADAEALNKAMETLKADSAVLTDHEKRLIELRTRREIDDRETAEFRGRYQADQAEVKASLRRIEDAMMQRGRP